jgi:glycosyltransferase involved in cell wall biosynthesis
MNEAEHPGKVVVVGAFPDSLTNFRGDMLSSLSQRCRQVIAMSAQPTPTQLESIRALGVQFQAYYVKRNSLNPLGDARTLWDLIFAFRSLRPDVVLAYTIKAVIWSGIASRFCGRPRFIGLITGLGFAFQGATFKRRLLTWMVSQLYRFSLKRAAKVVFQNADNRNEFVKRHIVPLERTTVVNGSGVDLSRFAVADLPKGQTTFLLVARLLGDKGVREYVAAARLVKQKNPNCRFLLVGIFDPSPDGISRGEVEQWEKSNSIEFLGELKDVRPAIQDCHVYVLPSYHEGMPRTVLEAMSMARPIITTQVPGCKETVVDGKNGFLVPSRDVISLANKMQWFLDNTEQIPVMGCASREMAEQMFDVQKVNQQLIDILLNKT